jgi:hypothetical protein
MRQRVLEAVCVSRGIRFPYMLRLLIAISLSMMTVAGEAEARVLSGKISLPKDGASMRRTNLPKTRVSEAKPERLFRINAKSATLLNVTVTGPFFKPRNGMRGKSSALHDLTAEVACELIDANDQIIAASNRAGLAAELLRRVSISAGTHFLRVRYLAAGPEEDRTDILVLISAGPDWDIVSNGDGAKDPGEAHHVGLLPVPGRGRLEATRPTWITTHGRNDAPGTREDGPGTFLRLAKALASRDPAAQQALLDWTTAAAPKSTLDLGGGRWFPKIGTALGERLAGPDAPRFAGAQLSLVGHSWGSYVNHEIAQSVREIFKAGKVSRCVALDPALTADNYDVGATNLSTNAEYSFALYSSAFGNRSVAQTAHDSFNVDVQGVASVFEEHNAAHQLFGEVFTRTDRISTALRAAVLDRVKNAWERDPLFYDTRMSRQGAVGLLPPFPADQDFEGLLEITPTLEGWKPVSLIFDSKNP